MEAQTEKSTSLYDTTCKKKVKSTLSQSMAEDTVKILRGTVKLTKAMVGSTVRKLIVDYMLAGFLEIFWKGVVWRFYVFPFSVAQVLKKVGGWVCEGQKMPNQLAYLNWPEHLRRSFCSSSRCACPCMWLCALDFLWRQNHEY